MHRYGYTGKKSSSNTSYCWGIWERGAKREFPQLFDWREVLQSDSHARWLALNP